MIQLGDVKMTVNEQIAYTTLKNFIDWYTPNDKMKRELTESLNILVKDKDIVTKNNFEDFLEGLSVRSSNVLVTNNIRDFESLVHACNNDDIIRFRNLGRKSYQEICEKLIEWDKLPENFKFTDRLSKVLQK